MKMIKVEDFNLSADYDNGHISNELVIALRIDDETAAELKKACSNAKPLLRDADIAEGLMNPVQFEKERDSMDNFERIEITFKSGETISYGKGEWDDYAYDGKAVIVKQKGAWIGIYNFDDVFCVELK